MENEKRIFTDDSGKKYVLMDTHGFGGQLKVGDIVEYCREVGKIVDILNEEDIVIEIADRSMQFGKRVYNVQRMSLRKLEEYKEPKKSIADILA